MSSKVMIAEANEMLNIHERLLKEAQLIQESWPRLESDIDRDIGALYAKKNSLRTRFDRSTQDIAHFTKAVEDDRRKIAKLHSEPMQYKSQRALTKAEQLAKAQRIVAQLEAELAKG